MTWGGLILTGGRSSRMGTDKALIDWAGVRAVDRVAATLRALVEGPIFTVGMSAYGLPQVMDAQPFWGPVGGIVIGAEALNAAGCEGALILAVDAPTLRVEDIQPLLERGGDGAIYTGFPLPMAVRLHAIPPGALAGWPVMRLVEGAGLARLPCPDGALSRMRGANTPEEREVLLAGLEREEGG